MYGQTQQPSLAGYRIIVSTHLSSYPEDYKNCHSWSIISRVSTGTTYRRSLVLPILHRADWIFRGTARIMWISGSMDLLSSVFWINDHLIQELKSWCSTQIQYLEINLWKRWAISYHLSCHLVIEQDRLIGKIKLISWRTKLIKSYGGTLSLSTCTRSWHGRNKYRKVCSTLGLRWNIYSIITESWRLW